MWEATSPIVVDSPARSVLKKTPGPFYLFTEPSLRMVQPITSSKLALFSTMRSGWEIVWDVERVLKHARTLLAPVAWNEH